MQMTFSPCYNRTEWEQLLFCTDGKTEAEQGKCVTAFLQPARAGL